MTNNLPLKMKTRARGSGDTPPNNDTITHNGDGPPTEGDEVRSGIGEITPETTAEGDSPPARGYAVGTGTPSPSDTAGAAAGGVTREVTKPPGNSDKNLCHRCRTLFKLTDGTRMCMHKYFDQDVSFVPDIIGKSLDIHSSQRQLIGTSAYVRG